MAFRMADTVVNAAITSATDLANGGKFQLWSGAMPATLGAAPAGSLLAEFTFDATAFGAASGGSRAAAGMPKTATGTVAAGTGTTIGFARILNNAATPATLWEDDNIGTTGSGKNIIVNTMTVSEGVAVELSSYSMSSAPVQGV